MEQQQEKQQETQNISNKNQPNKTGRKGKCCPHRKVKQKGDRSFLEGCLFALCCCWVCDICFDTSVVIG